MHLKKLRKYLTNLYNANKLIFCILITESTEEETLPVNAVYLNKKIGLSKW